MKRKLSARGLPLAVDGGALVALKSGISLVFHKAPPRKEIFGYLEIFSETYGRFVAGKQIRCAVHLLSEGIFEGDVDMRKKLSLEEFERLIEAWGVLERLSRIDLGTYSPIVTASDENPFALALGSPGTPVSARLETPEGPVDLTVSWNPKVEKPRDLMAEQARRRSSSGSLAASGKKPDSEKKKPEKSDRPEDQDDLGIEPSRLDSQGAFNLTVRNAPEGFELQDIRFVRKGSDDQPITPVMRTGEVVIPDSDCDGAIESLDSKVQGRVTHRGPSRAPHKQASADEDSQEDGESYTQTNNEARLLTPNELQDLYLKAYEAIKRSLRIRFGSDLGDISLDDMMQAFYIVLLGKSFEDRGERANFSYLKNLAKWFLQDQYRKTIRRSMKSLDASHDTNDSASTNHAEFVEDYRSTALRDALVETDQLERLRSAIQNLPQDQLDLLIATKVEGRSQKDIAEKMGISVQAVKNRLLRAKMALRELFESEPE